MIFWLAIRLTTPFEILGLYSSKTKAAEKCSELYDVVGPLTLDEDLPEEITEWPGAFYPRAKVSEVLK